MKFKKINNDVSGTQKDFRMCTLIDLVDKHYLVRYRDLHKLLNDLGREIAIAYRCGETLSTVGQDLIEDVMLLERGGRSNIQKEHLSIMYAKEVYNMECLIFGDDRLDLYPEYFTPKTTGKLKHQEFYNDDNFNADNIEKLSKFNPEVLHEIDLKKQKNKSKPVNHKWGKISKKLAEYEPNLLDNYDE